MDGGTLRSAADKTVKRSRLFTHGTQSEAIGPPETLAVSSQYLVVVVISHRRRLKRQQWAAVLSCQVSLLHRSGQLQRDCSLLCSGSGAVPVPAARASASRQSPRHAGAFPKRTLTGLLTFSFIYLPDSERKGSDCSKNNSLPA